MTEHRDIFRIAGVLHSSKGLSRGYATENGEKMRSVVTYPLSSLKSSLDQSPMLREVEKFTMFCRYSICSGPIGWAK